jgi:hypothetical protein
MKKILLSLLALLFLISFVNAESGDGGINIRIVGSNLTITGYYYSLFSSTDTINATNEVVDNFYQNLSGFIRCRGWVNGTHNNTAGYENGVNITNTQIYPTDCEYVLDIDISKQLPLKNSYMKWLKNISSGNLTTPGGYSLVNTATEEKYISCLNDKSQVETNLRVASSQYIDCNNTKDAIVQCTAEKATCQATQTTLQKTVDDATKNLDDEKNTRYIYLAVGCGLGVAGTLYFKGHIGGPKTRRPEETYNRGQAA